MMIKAFIKRPDEGGHIARINGSVTNFENTIGGDVTWVKIAADMLLIYREDNVQSEEQPEPVEVGGFPVYGTFIVCGIDKRGTLVDFPVSLADFKKFWINKREN